jgi:hypothetical protein
MQQLRCVILEHAHRGGRHFDWLFERPEPAGLSPPALWSGRIARPPRCWSELDRLMVQRLGDHRRRYLTAQGKLSGGRGRVRRVDTGWVRPLLWRQGRLILYVDFQGWAGQAVLTPLHGSRWLARLKQDTAAC